MSANLSPVEAGSLVCEEGHPIQALFAHFPWLRMISTVCNLFNLMFATFGSSLSAAKVRVHTETATSLRAEEMRELLKRFRVECPIDVIFKDTSLDRCSYCNLCALFSDALADIKDYPAGKQAIRAARRQTVEVFCQLLLSIGLSSDKALTKPLDT